MPAIVEVLGRYGYVSLGAALFLEAVGLPVPGAVALVIAGAAAATGAMHGGAALVVAVAAMFAGDVLLYSIGRRTGWQLLGFLCGVSTSPETCILRSAQSFYVRGRSALALAKFLPGLNTMAPPLAGSMKMGFGQFALLDLIGAVLYAGVYGGAGYLGSEILEDILRALATMGTALEAVAVLALVAYVIWRVIVYRRNRVFRLVPRLTPAEMEALQKAGTRLAVADARSHGYYDANAQRILGSFRLEPNNLYAQTADLPKDEPVVIYCTCPNDVTAARVAYVMRLQGFDARVLQGGLSAWRKAALPVETVPADDVVLLPSFRATNAG